MDDRHMEEAAVRGSDCEFVPPPRLPETWGLSWERQMIAALAWQTANAAQRGSERPVRVQDPGIDR